ncbi:MAG: G1 family glutamic endopeptidase [Acidimicrobiales bacterium]
MFTNTGGSATTNPATLTVTNRNSYNWSGYVDTGPTGTFASVNGDWTVPTLTCNSGKNAYASAWIGIDGYGSSTVEQDGIEADCNTNNVASYYAWYEMYGDNNINSGNEVQLPAGHPVSPGDAMSASISVVANVWTLEISDSTQGWHYTRSPAITFSAAQESAEWIVERPEVNGNTAVPLADFGSVAFTNATVNGTTDSISAFTALSIEMVDSGSAILAAPGPLSSSGENFTDNWEALGP